MRYKGIKERDTNVIRLNFPHPHNCTYKTVWNVNIGLFHENMRTSSDWKTTVSVLSGEHNELSNVLEGQAR